MYHGASHWSITGVLGNVRRNFFQLSLTVNRLELSPHLTDRLRVFYNGFIYPSAVSEARLRDRRREDCAACSGSCLHPEFGGAKY